MELVAIFRRLRSAAVFSIFSLCMVLAGCSENNTGPAPTDGNPPGTNATIDVSDPVSAQEAADVRSNSERNERDSLIIPIDQAITIAIQQAGGGELYGVTLDYDSDELNYECVVRQGNKVYLIVVDPQDGSVKKKEEISNHYYRKVIIIRPIVIKIKEAKEKAKRFSSNGNVVECNLENIDDRPTYIVVILTRENRYLTVYIDAEDGKERKLKNDGTCDDDSSGSKKHKKGRGHYRHGKGKGYGHHYHCHCKCDDDNDTTKTPAGIISVDSVRTIVGGTMDSLTVNEVKLRVENDSTARYEVKATRDSNQYEIHYDAFTGSFISIKQTAGNLATAEFQPKVQNDTLVAFSVARTAATAQVAGSVTMWSLEYNKTDARWIYTIEIQPATGGKKQVLVDAKTGTFIRIK